MLLRTWLPYDWTPRSEAYFVFPLAQGTPGKQCGLAATGVYQPSLRSPWLAAIEKSTGRNCGGLAGYNIGPNTWFDDNTCVGHINDRSDYEL
ncbi:hypothetical protein, partial [Thiolapillus sp.]|uniref:hypothetical protein n=1 Tax=Thiolapillus sp. TaxID=2017437 RepID=UPI003AF42F38